MEAFCDFSHILMGKENKGKIQLNENSLLRQTDNKYFKISTVFKIFS